MSMSLYKATIPNYLQILNAVFSLLDKAEDYCKANDLPVEHLIQGRLAEDMLPFSYQVTSVAHHSADAIDGIRQGVFSPDNSTLPEDFSALRNRLDEAKNLLEKLTEAELESFVGRPVRFEASNFKIDFVAEEFLLSFSQPNFYFHATTAYDILRYKGLQIGKVDFLGKLRRIV